MDANPFVSIIIPTLNAAKTIVPCLEAIEALEFPRDRREVIIADHGSTDATLELARRFPCRSLRVPEARSISELRNRGAASSSGEIIAFLDSDCTVQSAWLTAALRCMTETGANVVGAEYLPQEQSTWVERTWHELRASREIEQVDALPSGNLILTRSAFETVGGFDEGFATGEDTDLCLRLKKAGYRLVACSAIKVIHLNEPKTLGDLYRKQLWHGRGMLKVARRHYRTGAAIVPLVSLGYLAGFMAILVFVALGLFAPAALIALSLILLAPALFSLIKRAQGKRTLLPASMAFYLVYFAARASSLVRYNQWKDLVGTNR